MIKIYYSSIIYGIKVVYILKHFFIRKILKMRKTIYYVTKDKYDDAQRVLGFVKDFGVHIYYDFFSHKVQLTTKTDGSHFSYHEDGNVYRTSKGIGKEKICETIPVKKFSSYYDLCTTAFEKDTVNDLKPLKEKYKKDQQYHII